jgi:hypothetical protein
MLRPAHTRSHRRQDHTHLWCAASAVMSAHWSKDSDCVRREARAFRDDVLLYCVRKCYILIADVSRHAFAPGQAATGKFVCTTDCVRNAQVRTWAPCVSVEACAYMFASKSTYIHVPGTHLLPAWCRENRCCMYGVMTRTVCSCGTLCTAQTAAIQVLLYVTKERKHGDKEMNHGMWPLCSINSKLLVYLSAFWLLFCILPYPTAASATVRCLQTCNKRLPPAFLSTHALHGKNTCPHCTRKQVRLHFHMRNGSIHSGVDMNPFACAMAAHTECGSVHSGVDTIRRSANL